MKTLNIAAHIVALGLIFYIGGPIAAAIGAVILILKAIARRK